MACKTRKKGTKHPITFSIMAAFTPKRPSFCQKNSTFDPQNDIYFTRKAVQYRILKVNQPTNLYTNTRLQHNHRLRKKKTQRVKKRLFLPFFGLFLAIFLPKIRHFKSRSAIKLVQNDYFTKQSTYVLIYIIYIIYNLF